jgi:MoaA/NifB/PqqE/SkfB family radical SAM enzyme
MLDPEILTEYNHWRQAKNKEIFCHAPFTNVNFSQNGDANACCYNRSYVLGSYPHDSVDEMWYGPRAQKLREFMRRNALPQGCQICVEQFRSHNFGGLRARFYDKHAEETWGDDGRRAAPPKVMEFEISNVCNLECTMCNGKFSSAIRGHREGLSQPRRPFDGRFVEQLDPYLPHLAEAKFLGGEPFLNTLYYRIWERIARVNPAIEVSIITNGTILNDKVKRALEPLNAHINVSIDALDPANYERIRVNAKFDQVMENFAYFLEFVERKRTAMTVSVCPMRQNWHEIPDFLRFCNDRNIKLFFNTVLYPEEASLRYLAPARLQEVLDHLRDLPVPDDGGVRGINKRNYIDLIHQIEAYRDRTVIPDYERFGDLDMTASLWSLSTAPGSAAELTFGSTEPDMVRVTISQAATQSPWDIQLNRATPIDANHHYMITFRARARAPRPMCFGVTRAQSPREEMGKHKHVRLTSEWQTFQMVFGPIPRGGDARIHFDIGGSATDVEIEDFTLRNLAVPAQS